MDRPLRFSNTAVLLIVALTAFSGSGCSRNASTGSNDPNTTGNSGGTISEQAGSAAGIPDTPEHFRAAIGLLNEGITHLENKEWADAETALTALTELIPDSPVAARNLAVGRLLALTDRESPYPPTGSPEKTAAYAEAVQRTAAALDGFRSDAQSDYDKALTDHLQGRFLVHTDSPEKPSMKAGVESLRKAADAFPTHADFRFAVAAAMDGHREYSRSPDILKELQTAAELQPENLYVLLKRMEHEGIGVTSRDPQIAELAARNLPETLRHGLSLMKPLAGLLPSMQQKNIIESIEKALAEYDESKPQLLTRTAVSASHVLRTELPAQQDQRRISTNLLEYLTVRFDAPFMKAAEEAGVLPTAEPTVVTGFNASAELANTDGITCMTVEDFDLDGLEDIVLARNGHIEVHVQTDPEESEWRLLLQTEDLGITVFRLADLDRDFDNRMADIRNPRLVLDRDGDLKMPTDPAREIRWFDADLDIAAGGPDGIVVLRNDVSESGSRTLTQLLVSDQVRNVRAVETADLEADGDLDLCLAGADGVSLWANLDGQHFERSFADSDLPSAAVAALHAVDFNGDLAIDLIAVQDDGTSQLIENMLHSRFRTRPLEENAGSAACDPVDLQLDADWDLVGAAQLGLTGLRDVETTDLDNDGFTDCVAATDSGVIWIRGLPRGELDVDNPVTAASAPADFIACRDADGDGDPDIWYGSEEQGMKLLLTQGGEDNNWIEIVPRASPTTEQHPSNRCNMHGIGSVLELRAGPLYQIRRVNRPRIHVGMGKISRADAVRILWTDGVPQSITEEQLLRERIAVLAPQILKGSCPYIYTWTGDRFEFFSDCLWAAPLGLIQATGDLAPTREWENLLIPGERLAEQDGRYILQLTEELWEIAYFDRVELIAVDHPADVTVFTNEKVGPPDLAAHQIHTVRNRRPFRAVADGRGNDLTEALSEADGNYARAFTHRIVQGLTDEWTLEFDTGLQSSESSPQSTNLRLFLTGWVFPTDTSLNVGIHQNPALNPPLPPVVEVPSEDGNGWVVVRPFIGFPGGKTKTMVIDLSDVVQNGHTKFRLRSSMELYFDEAFFTSDETDAEVRSSECSLLVADLHTRGFSRRIYDETSVFREGLAPEDYDYLDLSAEPRWALPSGRFTRCGPVTELLTEHDDLMVVMAPGDELTVEFRVPDEVLPPGWKRDFVLKNVGFDKDADLNTLTGQCSEPYPQRNMTTYPPAADTPVRTDEQYMDYLTRFQTRTLNQIRFRDQLRVRRNMVR